MSSSAAVQNSSFSGVSKPSASFSNISSTNVSTRVLSVRSLARIQTLQVDSLKVGNSGNTIASIFTGTVSVNPGSITATTKGSVNVTISGLASSLDTIILQPPSTLNSGLLYVGHDITASNTVTIYLYNTTGAPIDDGATTWKYTAFNF
jgi:hypothetical protein